MTVRPLIVFSLLLAQFGSCDSIGPVDEPAGNGAGEVDGIPVGDPGTVDGEVDGDGVGSIESPPTFTRHVTDLDRIAVIVPPGSVAGNVIKAHSFLHIDGADPVSVFAPVDARLDSLAYYVNPDNGVELYVLQFQVNDDVFFYVDHLTGLSDTIDAVAPQTPANTSVHVEPTHELTVSAGDLLGSVDPGRNTIWDFGLFDFSKTVVYANPDRYFGSEKNLHADCPYDYFDDPLRSAYYARFGDADQTIAANANCRSASRDVDGTIAGVWFLTGQSDATYGSQLAIAANFQGDVKVGGVSEIWDRTEPIDPESIRAGDTACYDDATTRVLLRLTSATTLDVFYDSGACVDTSVFPETGFRSYVR